MKAADTTKAVATTETNERRQRLRRKYTRHENTCGATMEDMVWSLLAVVLGVAIFQTAQEITKDLTLEQRVNLWGSIGWVSFVLWGLLRCELSEWTDRGEVDPDADKSSRGHFVSFWDWVVLPGVLIILGLYFDAQISLTSPNTRDAMATAWWFFLGFGFFLFFIGAVLWASHYDNCVPYEYDYDDNDRDWQQV